MPAPNPIDVVERAYDLESDSYTWLEQIAHACYPLVDGGLGVHAYYYDVRTTYEQWFSEGVWLDVSDEDRMTLHEIMTTHSTADVAKFQVLPSPLESISDASRLIGVDDPRQQPAFRACMLKLRARDMFAFRTIEPGGKGIVISGAQQDDRAVDRRTKNLWTKVSAHLSAGRRLRERLTEKPFEAVLTPSGKLEHAEGDCKSPSTREALRTAVLRQEKARGRVRREDPEGATDMWTALVSGRWSLVDHFERGGRRYIVARRNEHGGADPRALAERERAVAQLAALGKSNKLIAYELGISESTVASHLSNAMRKLRVKTRVELLRLLMQMAQPSP